MPYVIVKPPSKVERDPWGTGRVRVQLSYAGTDIPVTHNTIRFIMPDYLSPINTSIIDASFWAADAIA